MTQEKQINNKRFWRDKLTWRSTNTGMNENVIGTYVHNNDRRGIITYIMDTTIPYTDGRRFLESHEKKDYFVDVVNECLKNIYHGKEGHVFSDAQLKEIIMIKPDVNIRWSHESECYFCNK
jgi:hypothetical protein